MDGPLEQSNSNNQLFFSRQFLEYQQGYFEKVGKLTNAKKNDVPP
jgi:hypothetical protein